jgi:predicted small secreted protein
MPMRRTLGTALLVTLLATSLAGCGADTDSTAGDPPSSTSTAGDPSSSPTDGGGDFTEVALVSQTGAGGDVTNEGTELGDAAAVAAFSKQFSDETLGRKLASAVAGADVPSDQTLVGAVVSIGCDVPPGVSVQASGGAVVITPLKVTSPKPECFAPVTTVALVSVDADAV